MRRTAFALLGGIAFSSGGFATPAGACVFMPVICVGDTCPQTAAQRRAFERTASARATRYWYSQARIRLRAGNVDFAADLAEMLVPNVRAVQAVETDCGMLGEIDYAEDRETDAALFQRIVSGTSLAGADVDRFGDFFREGELGFGEGCNAEFRRGAAAYLRQSVALDDLQDAWLFLAARRRDLGTRGPTYRRLVRFEGGTRTPPIVWQGADEWLTARVQRYVQSEPPGRRVAEAMQAFWTERAAQLGDDAQVCPTFSRQWESERERIVARMVEHQAARVSR